MSLLEIHGKLSGKILKTIGLSYTHCISNTVRINFTRYKQQARNRHCAEGRVEGLRQGLAHGLQYNITIFSSHICFIRTLCYFLKDRTAPVRLGSHVGAPIPQNTGAHRIPTLYSCLSPTLYSCYTQDISEPIINTDYICYADDITQTISGRFNTNRLRSQHNTSTNS